MDLQTIAGYEIIRQFVKSKNSTIYLGKNKDGDLAYIRVLIADASPFEIIDCNIFFALSNRS